MKDKLRDLAGEMRNELCSDFAQKLEAILDAEGDGGTPLPGVVWNERTNAAHLIKRGTEVEFCAEYGCCRVFTHPARSGVVSDEDVIHAWGVFCHSKEIADATTGDKNTLAHMRAALESFARITR